MKTVHLGHHTPTYLSNSYPSASKNSNSCPHTRIATGPTDLNNCGLHHHSTNNVLYTKVHATYFYQEHPSHTTPTLLLALYQPSLSRHSHKYPHTPPTSLITSSQSTQKLPGAHKNAVRIHLWPPPCWTTLVLTHMWANAHSTPCLTITLYRSSPWVSNLPMSQFSNTSIHTIPAGARHAKLGTTAHPRQGIWAARRTTYLTRSACTIQTRLRVTINLLSKKNTAKGRNPGFSHHGGKQEPKGILHTMSGPS